MNSWQRNGSVMNMPAYRSLAVRDAWYEPSPARHPIFGRLATPGRSPETNERRGLARPVLQASNIERRIEAAHIGGRFQA